MVYHRNPAAAYTRLARRYRGGARTDHRQRVDRVRSQGFGRQWLQIALLEQGLARVAIAPDRSECAPDLYEAEARGREKHAGIWALDSYQPRTPPDVASGSTSRTRPATSR